MNKQEIEQNFKYHQPTESQVIRYKILRNIGKTLATTIEQSCPESREKSLAFTKVEEAVMWANAAIARHERHDGVGLQDTQADTQLRR